MCDNMFWINLIPLEINTLRFVFLKKKRFFGYEIHMR